MMMRSRRWWWGGSVLAPVLVSACGGGVTVDRTLPVEAQWQEDLAFMVERLQNVHPDLYHSVSPGEFEAARARLHDLIPSLTEEEIFVELLRVFAMPARERDGHMGIDLYHRTNNRLVPLQFYRFAEGVAVVQAGPDQQHLLGRRLTGIGDKSMQEVDALIEPLVARDNESSLIGWRNLFYITPEILGVLGIVDDVDAPVYHFEDGQSEAVPTVAVSQYGLELTLNLPSRSDAPLYLTRQDETFWLHHFETERTLYLRMNRVRGDSGGESLDAFADRAMGIVDDGVDRVVLDLRQNNGGNNQLIGPILDFLSDERVDRPDRLFVLTDRNTFSAAGNLVAQIGAETGATFVGVAPGGSGSQYGDSERFDLPYSGIAVFIPTRHWVFGDPSYQPLMHPMDIVREPTAEDFLSGHDPVLDALLSGAG